ncbi:hypothetical protein L3Q82_024817 [Scortum barcoo]|uniref:Uncharacterized protein n=1 Tax=Scortum barcoo TaxID=214431 RepID=A0ACB8WQB9_9TELE|nr:hypothetical protein L3Q82_024817 [Scortum barcoo]
METTGLQTLPSISYHGKREVSAEQDGRANAALTRLQREYRECSLMHFTETWLNHLTPDSLVQLDGGFHLVRADRDIRESGKKKGGELRSAGREHPALLPAEGVFSHVIAITTYIPPPSANANAACELLHSVVAQLQTEHPQAFLPHHRGFQPRFPVCHSPQLPPLITPPPAGPLRSQPGPSAPCLHTCGEETAPRQRRVKQWSEEARDALRDCFDTTDWEVLCGPHEQDIDSLTDCITDYINFCVETTVPTKRVRCFSNNKPWVTPDLRALLQEKRRAFQSGDRDELRRVQRDLKRKIKECKASYRRKMEDHLQQNNAREVWRGLQAISGQGENAAEEDQSPGKPQGPDGISSRLLRDCADQLCQVVCYIFFNLSLSLERVPVLWKTSCVVPVPKTSRPKEPNHFRPVALTTSHLMKALERIVLRHLRPLRSLSHLEDAGNTVRITFFDFSSAFNTIHPSLLRVKLERAGARPDQLAAWVTNYLTDRPQFVRLQDCVSDVVVCSTGAPQGTVLSPFLFTLYTSDFTYSTDSCHLQKFSDDTAIVGCVSEGNDCEYRKVIMDFVDWCELNHLQVNASKTKEMVIDFSRKPSDIAPVNIQGLDIERVRTYKYLGVHLNNKLDWTD